VAVRVGAAQLTANASEVIAILKYADVQMKNALDVLRDANVLVETVIIKTVLVFVKKWYAKSLLVLDASKTAFNLSVIIHLDMV
jgi:hypothetical protein